MKFRDLKAEEIDVRVSHFTEKGAILLLYKDARVDMQILDETVGPMNWQRKHLRDNANCIIEIWDDKKEQWIAKEDTGTESKKDDDGNERKGLASDSFKRAGFNWGIGRELYTSPFIFVFNEDMNVNNKKTYDKFSVSHIEIEDKKILELEITNDTKKKVVFSTKGYAKEPTKTELIEVENAIANQSPKATEKQIKMIEDLYTEEELTKIELTNQIAIKDLTLKQASDLISKRKGK